MQDDEQSDLGGRDAYAHLHFGKYRDCLSALECECSYRSLRHALGLFSYGSGMFPGFRSALVAPADGETIPCYRVLYVGTRSELLGFLGMKTVSE